MHNIFLVLFTLTLCGLFVNSYGFKELDMQQVTSIVEFSNVVNFNLRVRKTSRLTYGVSGYIEILDDSMDKYTVTFKMKDIGVM